MSPKNLFRCLVAISLVTGLAAVAVTQAPGDVPQEWKDVYAWSGDGSALQELYANRWILLGIGIPFIVFATAAQLGLFFFWSFARPAYAVLVVLMVLATPFSGLVVELPLEAAFWELSLIADGAIVALSYSQPFSSFFESARA